MKRYRSAIRAEQVHAFAALCASRSTGGLFIHAGRTGPMSRAVAAEAPHIEILSGDRLIDLLTGRPLRLQRRAGQETALWP